MNISEHRAKDSSWRFHEGRRESHSLGKKSVTVFSKYYI